MGKSLIWPQKYILTFQLNSQVEGSRQKNLKGKIFKCTIQACFPIWKMSCCLLVTRGKVQKACGREKRFRKNLKDLHLHLIIDSDIRVVVGVLKELKTWGKLEEKKVNERKHSLTLKTGLASMPRTESCLHHLLPEVMHIPPQNWGCNDSHSLCFHCCSLCVCVWGGAHEHCLPSYKSLRHVHTFTAQFFKSVES